MSNILRFMRISTPDRYRRTLLMEDCPQYAAANLPTELCCVAIRAPKTAALSYLPNNLEHQTKSNLPTEDCS